MKRELSYFVFLFIFTILTVSGSFMCEAQLEWSTKYKITLSIDGSTRWVVERGTLLRTADDESNFFRYSSIEHLQEFSNYIDALVNETRLKTRRDMKVPHESLKITSSITSRTETSSYGIVKYQFDWLNFTQIKDTQIVLGDAFIEGTFLFGDGELILEYPKEFNIAGAKPWPDIRDSNQTLTWNRIGNLAVGEPALVFKSKALDETNLLQQYAPPILGTIVILAVGFTSVWYFRFRKKEKVEVSALMPKIPFGIESEEEKVTKLLKDAGGILRQSAITRELGFSRSKTSKLLSAMEKDGKIRRAENGRDKVVTLIQGFNERSNH